MTDPDPTRDYKAEPDPDVELGTANEFDTVDQSVGPTEDTHEHASITAKPDAEQPRDFGDFELLEEIARGGMGVVYRARQTSLNRVVALKMIRSGELADADEIKRFQIEAEAAAQLDHPGIVPVYEVGEYAGRQFFSMAYVEGESLADHVKGGPLPPGEAADLMQQITEAVQYSHERGVVHRDLKPGNVLLVADGKPRVTDFGLAKRTHADSELTASGQILGTPSYMPPEQAAGKLTEIGPHSDVYSLGAMLYCLLTGRPPFQAASVMETLTQVTEREPVPPRQLNPAVDRDLETICLKCLQKDVSGRYDSAGALADDLRRFASEEPISARPVSRLERGWRWCRRNRTLALVGGIALVLLLTLAIGGPLVAAYQAQLRRQAEENEHDARRAEQRATANYQESRQTIDKYVETVSNAELLKEERFKPLMRELLKDALAHYQNFIRNHRHDEVVSVDLASAVFAVGRIGQESGDKEQAIAAYREARQLNGLLARENPTDTKYQSGLATINNNLGMLYQTTAKPSEALAAYQQALRIFERLARNNPTVATYQTGLAASHNNLGELYSKTGKPLEALAEHQQGLRIREQLARDNPTFSEYQHNLAASHHNIGMLHSVTGKRPEALSAHQRAANIWERLARDNPAVAEHQSRLADSHVSIGGLYYEAGKRSDALASLQKALGIRERLARDNPTVTEYEHNLAGGHYNIGLLHHRNGKNAEALSAYRQAVNIWEQLVRDHPTVTTYQSPLSTCHNNIGILSDIIGKRSEALAAFQEALDIKERLARDNPTFTAFRVDLARSLLNMAILTEPDSSDGALNHLRRAISVLTSVLDREPRHADARSTLSNSHAVCAEILETLGRYQQAAEDWKQATRCASEAQKLTYESREKRAREKGLEHSPGKNAKNQ